MKMLCLILAVSSVTLCACNSTAMKRTSPAGKVLWWTKECPECSAVCTSTNGSTWTISDATDPKRISQSSFMCPKCGLCFTGLIERKLRVTPMVEHEL